MFVDRFDELLILEDLVTVLSKQQFINHPIREYTGLGGIGKSALLRQVEILCANYSVPYIYIDCQKSVGDAFSSDDEFNNLASEIKRNSSRFNERLLAESDLTPPSTSSVKDLVDTISLNSAVLAIDGINYLEATTITKLGHEVVFPIAQHNKVLVLISSRTRIDWGNQQVNFRIRRRTKSSALLTFSSEYTAQQTADFPQVRDNIQNVTCGHPEANDIIVQILRHAEESQDFDFVDFGDYERRLVQAIINDVLISRRIIPPEYFEPLRLLAVFRYINTDLPLPILTSIEKSVDWSNPIRFIEFIQELQKVSEFDITFTKGLGYEIDGFVRRSLSLYTRFFDSERFEFITRQAVEYFSQKYYRDPTNIRFLPEKIYHLADLYRLATPRRTDSEIMRLIQRELLNDIELLLANSRQLKSIGKIDTKAREIDSSTRWIAFNNLKDLLNIDKELAEKIGETQSNEHYPSSYLVAILNEAWDKFIDSGVGVIEILKHYKSLHSEGEPDRYDVSFRRASSDPLGITIFAFISEQSKQGISTDLETLTTKQNLENLGQGLYSLIPRQIQEELHEHSGPLVIEVNDATIPWELMHDGVEFLALRHPLGKRIRTAELPRTTFPKVPTNRFLLIGVPVPKQNKEIGADLEPLGYVEDELDDLQRWLQGYSEIEFDPANDILFGEEATLWEVRKKLTSGRYQYIHYAGHAIYDPANHWGGLVLFDGTLKLDDIRNSLRNSPAVFLNACHSAKEETQYIRASYSGVYTSGIASAFILGGAATCVASIREVRDQAGTGFTKKFYRELSKQVTVGEALQRTKALLQNSDDINWANYVLYGDPTRRVDSSTETTGIKEIK